MGCIYYVVRYNQAEFSKKINKQNKKKQIDNTGIFQEMNMRKRESRVNLEEEFIMHQLQFRYDHN